MGRAGPTGDGETTAVTYPDGLELQDGAGSESVCGAAAEWGDQQPGVWLRPGDWGVATDAGLEVGPDCGAGPAPDPP